MSVDADAATAAPAIRLDRAWLRGGVRARGSGGARIDVFRADLDALSTSECNAPLSKDERMRADRAGNPSARRIAASRALVRHVLAVYLDMSPSSVPLLHDRFGKPYVAVQNQDATRLHFNAAHCGSAWMLAVSASTPLGVDLEVPTSARFPDSIAPFVLSPPELAAYAALDDTARARFLAAVWVAKEALLKLHGVGLDVDPAKFAVPAPSLRATPSPWTSTPVAGGGRLYRRCNQGAKPRVAAIATAQRCDDIADIELGIPY